jgi:hypothetical protein
VSTRVISSNPVVFSLSISLQLIWDEKIPYGKSMKIDSVGGKQFQGYTKRECDSEMKKDSSTTHASPLDHH